MANQIKMMMLDVLKSHQPGVENIAVELSAIDGINSANITVLEIDAKTETLKVILEGENIDFDKVKQKIKDLGGTVHSVDKVISSKNKLKDIFFIKK
ncbi:MAG: DUF211 domain-containing protein [Elusimicrobiota bacterium]